MNLKKIILLVIVIVLFNACGEDSTSSSPTREESLENSEAISEDSSQREEETSTEITQENISQREDLSIEEDVVTGGNIWHVSTVAEFRQALEDASANGDHDTIVLDAGVYKTTEDRIGTFSFDDDEAYNLTIKSADGLTSKDVILDGDHTSQVFKFNNTEKSIFLLEGVSIIDGNISQSSEGGGVYSNRKIIVKECNISNNSAYGWGGGFYSKEMAKVINSTISYNNGGGFYAYGAIEVINSTISYNKEGGFYEACFTETCLDDTVKVINSKITNNSSAVGFYSHINTKIIDSTISHNHNSSGNGGGIYSFGKIDIENSTISYNSSPKSGGGFYSEGLATITDSNISNNIASHYGGGFYSIETTMINSTISNNNGDVGGGGFCTGKARLTNLIISNNSTRNGGGGFFAQPIIKNSIIVNNSAKIGGGFSSEKSIIINSIFLKNKADYGAIFYEHDTSYAINNTFIENEGSAYTKGVFINNIFDKNNEDISLYNDSKIYNNYIDYSKIEMVNGYNMDGNYNIIKKHNLQPSSVGDIYLNSDKKTLSNNSPVIDKGLNPNSTTFKELFDNDDIYNQVVELLSTDMDGKPRVINGTIDMGSLERQ